MISAAVNKPSTAKQVFKNFQIGKRQLWESLPPHIAAGLTQEGEEALGKPWPFLTLTLFQDYFYTGNRKRYEELYFAKRKNLCSLVLAECVENKGRFLDSISEGVWSIISEVSWVLPAHNTYKRDTQALPIPLTDKPILDLFVCETGALLSTTIYLLKTILDPLLVRTVSDQLDLRILTPYIDDYVWWMGLKGETLNNWTTWCTQNILITAFTLDIKETIVKELYHKSAKSLDAWLDQYGDDGCCDEGPSYYHHAASCLWGCLYILEEGLGPIFTKLYQQEKIKNIAAYIMNVHVADDLYLNYADSLPKAGRLGVREYLFGKTVKNPSLIRQALLDYRIHPFEKGDNDYNLFYRLLAAVHSEELLTTPLPKEEKKPSFIWYQSVGLAIYRRGPFTLAVKAGNNGDSHNHNDTGSIILYAGKKPLLIDVGVGTYTSLTFSPKRYHIWTMQSAYHNVVNFPPIGQEAGKDFGATLLFVNDAKIVLELRGAYPEEAKVKSYIRTVTITPEKVMVHEFVEGTKEPMLTLMSPERCTAKESDLVGDGWNITVDGNPIELVVTQLCVEDPPLVAAWGNELYRTTITFDTQLTWCVSVNS